MALRSSKRLRRGGSPNRVRALARLIAPIPRAMIAAMATMALAGLSLPILASAAPPPAPPALESEAGGEEGLPGLGESGEGDTDGLDPAALEQARQDQFRDHLSRAERAARESRWTESIREYSAALKIFDNEALALRGRGLAYAARAGDTRCSRQAIEDLSLLRVFDPKGAWMDERGTVLELMARCEQGYRQERIELGEELAKLEADARGRPELVQVLVADFHREFAESLGPGKAGKAHRDEALAHLESYAKECATAGRSEVTRAMRSRGDAYRELGKHEDALAVYRSVLGRGDAGAPAQGLDRIVGELELQLRVKELAATQGGLPSEAAEAAFNRGVQAMRGGDLSRARRELERAVEESQWFPRAHHYLGQVYARTERLPQAIESFQKAIAMAPSDYETHMALGLLYKNYFAGAQDAEAADQFETALKLRPDIQVLHFYLGELKARVDKRAAREHFEAFLRSVRPDDAMAERARDALRDLEREVKEDAPIVVPPAPTELRRLDPELYRLITQAYVLGTENGEWDRAEKSLLKAMEAFPEEPALYNELAKIEFAQEHPGKARGYWERSLELKAEQTEVHERLGILLADSELGFEHLRTAAALGSLTARFVLAERHWDRLEPWEASRQLERYEAEAGPLDIDWERAQLLRVRMGKFFTQVYLALGVLIALLIAIPVLLIYRRLRGASLRQLLEIAPKSYPEIARILSLIRHEILKHNTAFLADVGRALELGEPGAERRATLLARRMFGEVGQGLGAGDGTERDRGGIYGRFLGYVQELQKVGRANGVTLNLHRKDAIFSAMLRAFDELADHAKELRHPGGLSASKKLALAGTLNRGGEVLGRRAFEKLSGLIESLCISRVDSNFVQEVFSQVSTEAQFAEAEISSLAIAGEPVRIRIFRTDLEDILVNVFRNSLGSSLRYAAQPVTMGVDLVTEIDEITGLTSLAIRIKDRSVERLTSEMLRGRYVERGMGITADLLSRYDGAIAVEPEAGWEKAVVLRFFSLEQEPG